MHKIEELKDKLCEELEEYARRGEITSDSLCKIDMLAHAAKNLGKLMEMSDEGEEEDGYSRRYMPYYGMAYADGDMGGSSNRGSSYARGRMNARRDSMGRYSREGGYSYDDGMEGVISDIRSMAASFPDDKRRKVERLITEIER